MRLPRVRLTLLTFMLLTLAAALSGWLYVETVRQEVAHSEGGNPPLIPLDIIVLDAATGRPVRGAKVDLPFLHPSWRDRPDMKVGDLRREHGPPDWRPSPLMTGGDGAAHTALKAGRKSRIEHHAYGLLPAATRPEVVFHPVIGLRVEADGYETWVKFLNDIAPDDGRRLDNLISMPITVRLKPVDRRDSP
jgi:hypothetical protein